MSASEIISSAGTYSSLPNRLNRAAVEQRIRATRRDPGPTCLQVKLLALRPVNSAESVTAAVVRDRPGVCTGRQMPGRGEGRPPRSCWACGTQR